MPTHHFPRILRHNTVIHVPRELLAWLMGNVSSDSHTHQACGYSAVFLLVSDRPGDNEPCERVFHGMHLLEDRR